MTISLSGIPKLDIFKIDVQFFPKIITEEGYQKAFKPMTSILWNKVCEKYGWSDSMLEQPPSFNRLTENEVIPLSSHINASTLIKRKFSTDGLITIDHRFDEFNDQHIIAGYATDYDGAEFRRPGIICFNLNPSEIEGIDDIPLTAKIDALGTGGFYISRFYIQVLPLEETRRFYSKHYVQSRCGDGARVIHQNNTGFGDSLIAIPANYDKAIVGCGLRPGFDAVPGGDIFNDHFGVVLVDST